MRAPLLGVVVCLAAGMLGSAPAGSAQADEQVTAATYVSVSPDTH